MDGGTPTIGQLADAAGVHLDEELARILASAEVKRLRAGGAGAAG